MPEISEQEWAELKQQVANLANQLNQARNRIEELEDFTADHIGLDWGESLVNANSPHPNISVNTIESGGGTIRQDSQGMQVATFGDLVAAIYFGQELVPTPDEVIPLRLEGAYSVEDEGGQIRLVADATDEPPETFVSASKLGTSRTVRLQALDEVAAIDVEGVTDSRAWVSIYGAPRFKTAITPSQLTGNADDYDPTGNYRAAVMRLSSDASRDITGIAGGVQGRILIIVNIGSFNIVLKNDVTSTAANRFLMAADLTLAPNEGASFIYDDLSSRWRRF